MERKKLAFLADEGIITVTIITRWHMKLVFAKTASYYASFGWARFMSTGTFVMPN
jgi:hypothetical protein